MHCTTILIKNAKFSLPLKNAMNLIQIKNIEQEETILMYSLLPLIILLLSESPIYINSDHEHVNVSRIISKSK